MQQALLAAALLLGVGVAAAQNPLQSLPRNYQLEFQNQMLRVVRVHYGPHQKLPVHDHPPGPTIWVYLDNAGPVRFLHVAPNDYPLERPAVRQGGFRIDPGKSERHAVDNVSPTSTDFLRVELNLPTGIARLRARVQPHLDPARSSISAAFSSPELRIERIVCAAHQRCPPDRARTGTLVIAITPASVAGLGWGQVRWLEAGDEGAGGKLNPGPGFVELLRVEVSKR